jgi:hypothetical protein
MHQIDSEFPKPLLYKSLFHVGIVIMAVLVIFFGYYGVYKSYTGNDFIWLGDYFWNSPGFHSNGETVDVIFVVVDHWEPGGIMMPLQVWKDYRRMWHHVDADGYKLQRSWFYPIEQFRFTKWTA